MGKKKSDFLSKLIIGAPFGCSSLPQNRWKKPDLGDILWCKVLHLHIEIESAEKIECKTNVCHLFCASKQRRKFEILGAWKRNFPQKITQIYIESSAGRRGTKWCLVIELPRRENYPSLLRLLNFLRTKNNNESWTFVYGMCYKPLSQTY